MENSLTLTQEKAITVLQSSLYPGASTESVLMVLDYCKARKLDPFLKPVHIVPMWIPSPRQCATSSCPA